MRCIELGEELTLTYREPECPGNAGYGGGAGEEAVLSSEPLGAAAGYLSRYPYLLLTLPRASLVVECRADQETGVPLSSCRLSSLLIVFSFYPPCLRAHHPRNQKGGILSMAARHSKKNNNQGSVTVPTERKAQERPQ